MKTYCFIIVFFFSFLNLLSDENTKTDLLSIQSLARLDCIENRIFDDVEGKSYLAEAFLYSVEKNALQLIHKLITKESIDVEDFKEIENNVGVNMESAPKVSARPGIPVTISVRTASHSEDCAPEESFCFNLAFVAVPSGEADLVDIEIIVEHLLVDEIQKSEFGELSVLSSRTKKVSGKMKENKFLILRLGEINEKAYFCFLRVL